MRERHSTALWPVLAALAVALGANVGLPAQSPRSLAARAQGALLRGEAEQAVALYRSALQAESDPERRALLQYDLGTAQLAAKRPGDAREALLLALAASDTPLRVRAYYNLAHALAAGGDRDKAMGALREALGLDPACRDAALLYEWLLRQQPPPPEPPPPDQQPPPPAPKPPDLLEQIPTPPPKELQDQVREETQTPPGMKPW